MVEQCDRRGPIGAVYGYWDECLSPSPGARPARAPPVRQAPPLHGDEVGRTMPISDTTTSTGRRLLDPGLPAHRVLDAISLIPLVLARRARALLIFMLVRQPARPQLPPRPETSGHPWP